MNNRSNSAAQNKTASNARAAFGAQSQANRSGNTQTPATGKAATPAQQRPGTANTAPRAGSQVNQNQQRSQTSGANTSAYANKGLNQAVTPNKGVGQTTAANKGYGQTGYGSNQNVGRTTTLTQQQKATVASSVQQNRKDTFLGMQGPQENGIAGPINAICNMIQQEHGAIPTVLHYFQDWDCYNGRIFNIWELDVIFQGRIPYDALKKISEANQAKEPLFNDQISFKFLSLEIEASGAFPQIQTSVQPMYSLYEEKWSQKVDKDQELKDICKQLSQQRDIAYNPEQAFDRHFQGKQFGVDQVSLQRGLVDLGAGFANQQVAMRFADFIRTKQLRDSVVDKVMVINVFKFLLSRYNPDEASKQRNMPVPLTTNNAAKEQLQKPIAPIASVNPIPSPRNAKTNLLGKTNLNAKTTDAAADEFLLGLNKPIGLNKPKPLLNNTKLPESPRGTTTALQNKGKIGINVNLANKTGTAGATTTANVTNTAVGKPQQAQNLTVDSKTLLITNKICAHLDMHFKQIGELMQIPAYSVSDIRNNTVTQAYRQEEFKSILETNVHISPEEAQLYALHFMVQQAGDQQFYVCQRQFEDLVNSQRSKYNSILTSKKLQIQKIVEGLRERRSGPYKWFLGYSGGSNEIDRAQWLKAVNPLTPKDTDLTRYQVFDALDLNKSKKVDLADIEGLFKAFARNKFNTPVQVDRVMEDILKAFAVDEVFIDRGLSKLASDNFDNLQVDVFTTFFGQFPQHEKFYKLEDITALGEIFVISQGQIDLQQFLERLVQCKRAKNMMRSQGFQGIQAASLQNFQGDRNAFTPHLTFTSSSPDQTRAYQMPGLQRPLNFQPIVRDESIQDMQKACFLQGVLIEDYFQRQASFGGINLNSFFQACQMLQLQYQWDMNFNQITQELFNEIDKSTHNGSMMGQVSQQDIDKFVHFVSKSKYSFRFSDTFLTEKLEEIHRDLVYSIHEKLELRRGQTVPIETALQQRETSRTAKTVTTADLANVFQSMGIDLKQLDVKFLCSQYIQANSQDQVHYIKLLDDLKHVGHPFNKGPLDSKLSIGVNSSQAQGKDQMQLVCEAIVKRIYILGINYSQWMATLCPSHFMTENDFYSIFGEKLQLIPQLASAQDLKLVFSQLSNGQLSIPVNDVMKFVQTQAPKSNNEMQSELLKTITEKMADVNGIFQSDQHFQQGRGQMTFHAFVSILTSRLYLNQINAEFLATFYKSMNQQVDANRFLQDQQQMARFHQPVANSMQNQLSANQFNNNSQYNPMGAQNQPGIQSMAGSSEQFKLLLSKIAQEVKNRGIELAFIFGQYQSQMRGPYINKMDFTSVIRNQFMIDYKEMELLQQKYAHPDPTQSDFINLTSFMEDVKQSQMTQSNFQQLNQLNENQKKNYQTLSNKLSSANMLAQLVMELKMKDTMEQGYLSAQIISEAVNSTLRKISPTAKTLTEIQIKNLLKDAVGQNNLAYFNYKEFIQHLVGVERGQQLFLMDLRQLSQEAERERSTGGRTQQSAFVQPTSVTNAENQVLGSIGGKFLASNTSGSNYEDKIKNKLGGNAQDIDLNEQQLFEIMRELGIQLTPDEQMAHQAWFQSRGRNPQTGKVPADVWLKALGLPCQTIFATQQSKATKKKLLSDEVLKTCQQFLFEIAQELLKGQGGRLDRRLEKYRDQASIKVMKPINFKKMLQKELSPQLMKKLTDDHIKNMIHYLVREEPGMVSWEKLYEALQQQKGKPPLSQEGVDDLKKYTQQLKSQMDQSQINKSALHLLVWMQNNNQSISTLFLVQNSAGKMPTIPLKQFKTRLDAVQYVSNDLEELIDVLDHDGKRNIISLERLNEAQKFYKKDAGTSKLDAKRRYGNLDQIVRLKLDKISQFLQQNNYTTVKLHEMLDTNKDGYVDKLEFTTGFEQYFKVPGLVLRDYNSIFDAIDLDNNGYLSVNEFCMFIEGAQLSRDQRINQIPQQMIDSINEEIDALFRQFDINGDGQLEAHEILTSMRGLGYTTITMEKAQEMIQHVAPGKQTIVKPQFRELMLPVMTDMLLAQEDNLEQYRDMFRQADTNYSGYLSADEIYTVLLQNGVELDLEELVELMSEFDMDGNAQLEIDEFVAMMSMGDGLSFTTQANAATYLKIRKARKLNVMDFMKAFQNLPAAFTPSISCDKWKQKKNLPSGVLKPMIDPRTMLWKDMYPVISEQLTPEMQKPDYRPQFRPIESKLGIEITLDSAEGIMLPKDDNSFKRSNVLKRAVRVGMFDEVKRDYVANIIQVPAEWNASKDGSWKFNLKKDIGLNPVLLRQSIFDLSDPAKLSLVFEFVLYLKTGEAPNFKITELSCGFAKLQVEMATKNLDKFKIEVKGGSPMAEEQVKPEDLKDISKKGVFGGLFGGKNESVLYVTTRQHQTLEEDTKLHLQMLPGLCLIHKRMVHFVSGFRNYAAEHLLREVAANEFKQPGGDVAISTFPAVYDNPEIIEILVRVWTQDIVNGWNAEKKKNIKTCMQMSELYLSKLYPVLFSYDFDTGKVSTESSIGMQQHEKIKQLIESALRYDAAKKGTGPKAPQPIESLTQFKPFNVREIQFEVWDTKKAMQEQMLQKFDSIGVVNSASVAPGQSARQTNMTQFLQGTATLNTGATYSGAQYLQPSMAPNVPANNVGQAQSMNAMQPQLSPRTAQNMNAMQSPASPRRPQISIQNLESENKGIKSTGPLPYANQDKAAPNAAHAAQPVNALAGQQNILQQPANQKQQPAQMQAQPQAQPIKTQVPVSPRTQAKAQVQQPAPINVNAGQAPSTAQPLAGTVSPSNQVKLPGSGSSGGLPKPSGLNVSVSKTSTDQNTGAGSAGVGRGSLTAANQGPNVNIPAPQANKPKVDIKTGLQKK